MLGNSRRRGGCPNRKEQGLFESCRNKKTQPDKKILENNIPHEKTHTRWCNCDVHETLGSGNREQGLVLDNKEASQVPNLGGHWLNQNPQKML